MNQFLPQFIKKGAIFFFIGLFAIFASLLIYSYRDSSTNAATTYSQSDCVSLNTGCKTGDPDKCVCGEAKKVGCEYSSILSDNAYWRPSSLVECTPISQTGCVKEGDPCTTSLNVACKCGEAVRLKCNTSTGTKKWEKPINDSSCAPSGSSAPSPSPSPAPTVNSSLPCNTGDNCKVTDLDCRYAKDSGKHCYCDKTTNTYKLDYNMKQYCSACSSKEETAKQTVCRCNWNNNGTTEKVVFDTKKCDTTYNHEEICDNPGGGMTNNPCLNGSKCVEGVGDTFGCVNEKTKCADFTDAIMDLVENANYKNDIKKQTKASGSYVYQISNSDYWASSLSLQRSMQVLKDDMGMSIEKAVELYERIYSTEAKKFKSGIKDEDVSCSNEENKDCFEIAGGGFERKCVSLSTISSTSGIDGCYIWSWVTGDDRACTIPVDGKYCAYDRDDWGNIVSSQSSGVCASQATNTASLCNPNETNDATKTYTNGQYGCGLDKKPIICKVQYGKGSWLDVNDAFCVDDECKKACEVKTSEACANDGACQQAHGSEDWVCNEQAMCVNGCKSQLGKIYEIDKFACGTLNTKQSWQCAKGEGWKLIKTCDSCDEATGKCAGEDTGVCENTAKSCRTDGFNDNKSGYLGNDYCADQCGGTEWQCVGSNTSGAAGICTKVGEGAEEQQGDETSGTGACKSVKGTYTGSKDAENEKCGAISSCSGKCVNFTVTKVGTCNNVTCNVSNNYDNYVSKGVQNGNSSNWNACLKPKTTSASSVSDNYIKGSGSETMTVKITCQDNTDGKITTGPTDSAACSVPQSSSNPYQKAEEAQQAAEEASTTEAKAKEEEKAEQEKQNKTAPKVTISSPTGTIKEKTASLKASTDIEANCTYSDSVSGGDTVTEMTMTGDGIKSHEATLSSLAKGKHTVTVTCVNSAANTSSSASTGSKSATYTVDLSQNEDYKPAVESQTDPTFTVANPVLKVSTTRPANCQYKEGSTFTYGSGTKFDTTGSYNHNTQLPVLTAGDKKYFVICQDVETEAVSAALEIKFTINLSSLANAPVINSVTSETQNVANPTLAVVTNIPAVCQYATTTFAYGATGVTQFTNDSDYSHTSLLSTYADGKYKFYVACKAKDSNASTTLQNPIETTLSRGQGAPNIESTTPETQMVANPALSVTTDRPAICQYKKDSTFTYGAGKAMVAANENYAHSVSLADYNDGKYTFYVACRDKDGTAADTLDEPIVTTLSRSDTVPVITNTTPINQNTNTPILSASTTLAATCQYKEGSNFTYGGGIQFSIDGNINHSVQLANVANGQHIYYIVCKDTASGNANPSGMQIVFTVNTSVGAPVISNTTNPNQTTSTPTLSVMTLAAATCQYKADSDFTYGGGTQFATDGGTGHSAQLPSMADGTHAYYVVCKDSATGATNAAGTQITFSVSTTAKVCAKLSSNDRQSDNDRDYDSDDDSDSDSNYLWRSIESGTREQFTNVDWYAGYQFTPQGRCSDSHDSCTTNSDCDDDETCESGAYVTQLCGYFADGESNKVTLYNNSFKALATATVSGKDDWECVSISSVAVSAGKHYYVIARVEDKSIYYEYESGMLPREADDVIVETGIRQLAGDDFGTELKKYDYMIFGLVDVKIKFTEESENGPSVSSATPTGTIDEDFTTISVETDEKATCKYDRDDVDYGDMKYTFGSTGNKIHEQKVCDLDDGQFTFYVRCKGIDSKEENDASTLIQFEVSD